MCGQSDYFEYNRTVSYRFRKVNNSIKIVGCARDRGKRIYAPLFLVKAEPMLGVWVKMW